MNESICLLDIQRMSSEDGPGLRATAFLKGCPISCSWCHNPESIRFEREVLWHQTRCMGCGDCARACGQNGIGIDKDGVFLDRARCVGCFACADACPTGALEGKGTMVSPAELCRELLKDRAYFGEDGGVTLSGGEALAQPGTLELLRLLKEAGAGTAVDTCGMLPAGRLQEALQFIDILLYDIKLADPGAHRRHTGADNARILENLRVAGVWAEHGGRLWIRTPIIPGATDSEHNIMDIGALLSGIPNIERWELCAFNNLCANKYESLNRTWTYDGVGLIEQGRMDLLLSAAIESGGCRDIRATGATKKEERP